MIAPHLTPNKTSIGWPRHGTPRTSHKTWLTLPRGIASQQVMIMLY